MSGGAANAVGPERAALPDAVGMGRSRSRIRWFIVGILVLAAAWRAAMVITLPCLSRDSVMFCWYARDLGERGLAVLREPTAQHHPLFPATVLAAQRIARWLGAPDTPMTWERSGQAVCWLAGMGVVVLTGALTRRFVRRLTLPIDAEVAGCCGMLLAALLPLNVGLSAEVMSDQMQVLFYLLGVWGLLKLDSVGAAVPCGLAGGLAFLTRPEGAMVVLGGVAALLAERGARWAARTRRGLVLVAAFLVCAGPYWAAVGTVSPQKNPLNWLRGWLGTESPTAAMTTDGATLPLPLPGREGGAAMVVRDCASAIPVVRARGGAGLLARLELLNLSWYALVPFALYQLFRAGRVVVPLLALFPTINLRGRWLRAPLAGYTVCLGGHLALTVLLLQHHHYLDVRHMLVAVMLLVPPAGMLLARLLQLARQRGIGLLRAVVAAAVLPLALYSLRQPNYGDRYLVDVASWLAQRDPAIATKHIMTASSERRIVFYTGARWVYWYDVPGDVAGPREQILHDRPDYFVIETGTGFERTGNAQVVEALRADGTLAARVKWSEEKAVPRGGTLHILCFDWKT